MDVAGASTITCPDGTELPIEWVYPEAPQYEWVLEREHWPGPLTPMERWVWLNGAPGGDRTWQEAGLEPPPVFYRFQLLGPFLYANATEPPPERIAAMAPGYMAAGEKYGGAWGMWSQNCEPRIAAACDRLGAMDAGADLREAAELLFYGFHQTFTCLGLLFLPGLRLNALLNEAHVADPELTSHELTQGGENATQRIDGEVWELAEMARRSPAVRAIIERGVEGALPALRAEPRAATFVAAFDDLMRRHGRRSQGWSLSLATWAERPEAALALVRAQISRDRVSPEELRARSARRRRDAMERALAAIAVEKHDELRAILAQLDGYVPVREDRAYWQLVIIGSMRGLLLRVGAALVSAGRIDRADDILFLTPDEIGRDGAADLRALVAAERAAWKRWHAFEPPAVIGTPGKVAEEAAVKRASLAGSAASRGVVTAPVRILHAPDEGERLQRGDILVCVMTTPAWTPLFAIAGGIITETGGALSHPAITAREYGIPAVVALSGATTRLRDGDIVTIDGATGAVTVH
jgi:phosphohistidine swiveling domain-containing protein